MCTRVFAVLFSLLLLLLRVLFSICLKLVVYLRLFLSSLLLLLFLGTTTRGGNLFLPLRFVGAHSRVIHDGVRRDLPSVRFFQLRRGILTGLIAKQTFSVRVALIVDDYGSFAVVHPLG